MLKKVIHLAVAVSVLAIAPLHAEAPRGGASDQTQALIQQLGMERTRLNAENAKLKKEIKELKKEAEALAEENARTDKELDNVQGQLNAKSDLSDQLLERLNLMKSRMDELIAKFRETVNNLTAVEEESATRAQEISRLERELKSCATNNVALSKIGYEVLSKYENKGFFDRAGQVEPFTQLRKVQIENMVDEYVYLIEDQEYALPEDLQVDESSPDKDPGQQDNQ